VLPDIAPDITGQDKANPLAAIPSGLFMKQAVGEQRRAVPRE